MSSAVIVDRLALIALLSAFIAAPAWTARAGEPAGPPASTTTTKPADTSEAEALFQEGRRLFDERKLDQACSKLAESHRLKPAINTVGLLAACYEEQGRLAAAAQRYREAEELAEPGDARAGFVRKKLAELRPKIGVLTIRLAQPEDSPAVTINDEPVSTADLNKEIFVDPGAVRIEASAPEREAWSVGLQMSAGEARTMEIPALVREASGEPSGPADAPWSPWRTAGFVAGGIGVVGLGVGAGFGFAAISKTNASNIPSRCDEQNRCSPEGGAIRDEARAFALVSTLSFGAGVVLAGAGLALILATGDESLEEPSAISHRVRSDRGPFASVVAAPYFGPGAMGVSVAGTFTAF
jgi:hypothetical protein